MHNFHQKSSNLSTLRQNSSLQLTVVGRNLKTQSYGRTICFNGNYYGKAAPAGVDCYYITVDSSNGVNSGYQKGGTNTIVWK